MLVEPESVRRTAQVDRGIPVTETGRSAVGFYIGGMGAKQRNFHKELMARMGFAAEADKIQDLFFEGKRAEAVLASQDKAQMRTLAELVLGS